MNPVETVSTAQMNEQIKVIAELRFKESEAKHIVRQISEELDTAEARMVEMLNISQLKNYKTSLGSVGIIRRTSVKKPESSEDWEALYAYIKSKGLYEGMRTIHSASLNKFYQEEFDQAILEGRIPSVPGIQGTTITEILSFRK